MLVIALTHKGRSHWEAYQILHLFLSFSRVWCALVRPLLLPLTTLRIFQLLSINFVLLKSVLIACFPVFKPLLLSPSLSLSATVPLLPFLLHVHPFVVFPTALDLVTVSASTVPVVIKSLPVSSLALLHPGSSKYVRRTILSFFGNHITSPYLTRASDFHHDQIWRHHRYSP